MKFKLNGAVWDKDEKKVLARGDNGIFETDDDYTIRKLKSLGYKVIGGPVEKQEIEAAPEEHTAPEPVPEKTIPKPRKKRKRK
ncbi:MAG TPA: hypothetical protein ENN69_01560 [Spirochaetia bacterium]|nr:hypothetical protein [Spirochaetia bacterium]